MRKLLIIFVCALVTGLMAGSVSASYYNIDISPGTKTFANEVTVSQGSNITVDIYLSGISEPQFAGGCWVDFSSSTGQLSYVNAGRALSDGSEGVTGPWNAGPPPILEPDGPGTLLLIVANLGGASPDGDGDLIVGRVTLNYTGPGDATITISIEPSIAIWTPEDDSNVANGNLTIQLPTSTTTVASTTTTVPTTSSSTSTSSSPPTPTTTPPTPTTTPPPPPKTTTTTIGSKDTTTTVKITTTTTKPSTTTIIAATTTTVLPPAPTTSTSSSTTTIAELCSAELIYGEHSEQTELLRYLRDNVLSQTPAGQEIIRLYYAWNPVLVQAMEVDDKFKAWLKEQIEGVFPSIRGTGK